MVVLGYGDGGGSIILRGCSSSFSFCCSVSGDVVKMYVCVFVRDAVMDGRHYIKIQGSKMKS
jgi:hypothetical protein